MLLDVFDGLADLGCHEIIAIKEVVDDGSSILILCR